MSSEHCGLYEFLPGFTAEGRRTGDEPLNLVIIHIMHHLLSDIFDNFTICITICIIMKALTKTDDLEIL